MINEFPTFYQSFIHKSRYAKWLDDKGRRETWEETVNRYLDFMESYVRDNKSKEAYGAFIALRPELFEYIYELEGMPSMRALMSAGPALSRDAVSSYNCAYQVLDSPRAFDEMMYILMCGTGVGFSCERQYVSKLPDIEENFYDTDTVITVHDSKIGWAKAFRELLAMLWVGQIPKWDLSKLRPAGARLKTFGGRSSGPAPLDDLFKFSVMTFKRAAGRKLSSLEAHDLACKIGEVVVVGGVRRSALLSLSNLSDDRMRNAKMGQWHVENPQRQLANNSVCYTEKPDLAAFMKEWQSLYASKCGERGIFSRRAAQAKALSTGRRDPDHEFGCNPCCVSGDTSILTSTGHVPIVATIGKDTTIWNGESWKSVVPYEAGEASLYRVSLSNGTYLDCTANHRWVVRSGEFVTTEDLCLGDKLKKFDMPKLREVAEEDNEAYSQGFYSGDGNTDLNHSWVYWTKFCCVDRLVGRIVSTESDNRWTWVHGPMNDKAWVPTNHSLDYRMSWLSGLLDADGTVTRDKNGAGFQVASIDLDFLQQVQLMLSGMGVRATISRGSGEGYRSMPDGNGGSKEYYCQTTWRLCINNSDAAYLVRSGLSLERLEHDGRDPQRDARRFVYITNVEDIDRFEMTYCFTEPETSRGTFNGIVTGNSEIILRPNQFCNLSELVVRPEDTKATLVRKAEMAAVLGTLQSMLTDFRYLRKSWKKNCEEERLLGVSLTGIMDNYALVSDVKCLTAAKQAVIDTNKRWAAILEIAESTACTTVKPSGTVSQLVDSASGVHARYSPRYVRRVRCDKTDPLAKFMLEAGFPCEQDVMNGQAYVFSFPIESPKESTFRDDLDAIEQVEVWERLNEYWCEHKVSCTIYYKDSEFLELGAYVYKNFDTMSGISFLPHSDHIYKQAPYEEITYHEYRSLVASMPKDVDWEEFANYEQEDNTVGSQTLACSGGVCEVVDLTK